MPKSPVRRPILIVSGDDQTYETISLSLSALRSERQRYPEVKYFLNGHDQMRLNATDAAKRLISPPDPVVPVLVVVDALVRFGDAPLANDGDAAIDLLNWLGRYHPAISVLVVATGSTEGLERRVLSRNNASLWRLQVSGTRNVLAEALAGIAPPPPKSAPMPDNRRITINVGRESATYRVSRGRYEFLSSGPISYEKRTALDKLMKTADDFTPWPKTGPLVPTGTWYDEAMTRGQKLFEILIKDTVGVHLLELLKNPSQGSATGRSQLDLRFEIDSGLADYEGLFKLPFELVNHEDFSGVLCSAVPMARRIRMDNDVHDATAIPLGIPADRPLRLLFIDASVSGEVRLRRYKSSQLTKTYTFGPLTASEKQIEILRGCADYLGNEKMSPVTVISQTTSGCTGDALLDVIRDAIILESYDIVHFYGHSCALEDGATYLIVPGDNDMLTALPVAQLAGWLRKGKCSMVALSSCEGASALTAIETMRHGVHGMIGFRWMVEEELCVKYFDRFYDSYLRHHEPFCEAYRSACNQLQQARDGSPAWASALAVLQD